METLENRKIKSVAPVKSILREIIFPVFLIFQTLVELHAAPSPFSLREGRSEQFCPVFHSPNVFNLSKLADNGEKVELEFFYPSQKLVEVISSRKNDDDLINDDTQSDEMFTTTESDNVIFMSDDEIDWTSTTTISPNNMDYGEETTTQIDLGVYDIFCEWQFLTGTDSPNVYLLFTFDKVSAPYSESCTEAFVAMQKYNGYESRWCGNRQEGRSRRMSIFTRSGAKIRVYRRANAPAYTPTGFNVTVELVDVATANMRNNSLRVLLG